MAITQEIFTRAFTKRIFTMDIKVNYYDDLHERILIMAFTKEIFIMDLTEEICAIAFTAESLAGPPTPAKTARHTLFNMYIEVYGLTQEISTMAFTKEIFTMAFTKWPLQRKSLLWVLQRKSLLWTLQRKH